MKQNSHCFYSGEGYRQKGANSATTMQGRAMMRRKPLRSALFVLLFIAPMLSGCTSLLEAPTVDPRADMRAYPENIESGETVTFDARESDPIEGVIVEFHWDFGDGNNSETIVGFTSHRYASWGTFVVSLTVVNDQGGEDSTSTQISVNGAPQINIEMPTIVKSGDTPILDASRTFDPEGGAIDFSWDLNWGEDSDGDGDPRNDVDSTNRTPLLTTNSSGNISGALTVTDDRDSTSIEYWSIEVLTRTWKVEWLEETLELSWEGYLDQGETWERMHLPGEGVILVNLDSFLELDRDWVEPQDNFTLRVAVPNSGWYADASTTSNSNITSNENASASVEKSGMNPVPSGGEFSADSEEILLQQLLNAPGSRFGQGEWTWRIFAEEADPDSQIAGLPDPDPGNDWHLTVTFTVLSPQIIEV